MSEWTWIALAAGATLLLYAAAVGALLLAGRRGDARALARFVPDCAVLFARLIRDPRVPRVRRAGLAVAAAYLAMPFDLVPDFVPFVGLLDDALVAGAALRFALRGAGGALIEEHWPGPATSRAIVLRAAGSPV
jgi:uncharacterized membrane protein YkvA (DUF1232 family)